MLARVESSASLEEFLVHPLEHYEWVDGQLVEKSAMTLRHSQIQARLAAYWRNYLLASAQGGEVYTEPLCRTRRQGRRPDVAYLTPELFERYARAAALPQSFPLIAEIASPEDSGEELLAKAREYLDSGCQEVWLVFPESCWIILLSAEQHCLVTVGEVVQTQRVLSGFRVAVAELLA